jgi:hypothetical protein
LRQKFLKACVSPAVRIDSGVACVAEPGEARPAHAHRCRQHRYLLRVNLQSILGHFDAPEIVSVNECVGARKTVTGAVEILRQAKSSL